jgi:hypothetical protein
MNANTNTTGASSILDIMLQLADEKFGKSANRTKKSSYISRSVALLTDADGKPTQPIKLNKLVAMLALEKATASIGHEPDLKNPEDAEEVSIQLKKCYVGVKQVFGTAENANSLQHNPAYKTKYKGIVNADGTVQLELIEPKPTATNQPTDKK